MFLPFIIIIIAIIIIIFAFWFWYLVSFLPFVFSFCLFFFVLFFLYFVSAFWFWFLFMLFASCFLLFDFNYCHCPRIKPLGRRKARNNKEIIDLGFKQGVLFSRDCKIATVLNHAITLESTFHSTTHRSASVHV